MKEAKTNLMRNAYSRWQNSEYDSIYKAYETPSDNKVSAWEDCKELCKKYDGSNLKVIGKSCYKFTAGFVGYVNGKKSFVFITDLNHRYMNLC